MIYPFIICCIYISATGPQNALTKCCINAWGSLMISFIYTFSTCVSMKLLNFFLLTYFVLVNIFQLGIVLAPFETTCRLTITATQSSGTAFIFRAYRVEKINMHGQYRQ